MGPKDFPKSVRYGIIPKKNRMKYLLHLWIAATVGPLQKRL